jgi:hypothetical protein
MTIHRCTFDSVCIHLTTLVPDIGVVTNIKICFRSVDDDTQVTCIGNVSFQKGRYPIPKGTAEKSAYDNMQVFYSTLFPTTTHRRPSAFSNASNFSATSLPKQPEERPQRLLLDMIQTYLQSMPPEYALYLIVFLVVMFVLNTMILWNLVYAMERQHQHILKLSKKLLELERPL